MGIKNTADNKELCSKTNKKRYFLNKFRHSASVFFIVFNPDSADLQSVLVKLREHSIFFRG